MDLSAAVDPTYMVQFTNAGMYIFDKTTGALADAVGLSAFWCTDKGVGGYLVGGYLAGCSASGLPATDVQIAHTSIYPGGRWVATTLSKGNPPYLWLGISKTNDPRGGWYLWSFKGCQDFTGSYPSMDQPILGVSRNEPGGPGRIIVGTRCFDSSYTYQGPDDIYDFNLNWLAAGNDVSGPAKTFCTDPSASCAIKGLPTSPLLVDLRPVNHSIDYSGRGVFLSAVYFPNPTSCTAGLCGTPDLYVYQLKLGSQATGDTLEFYNNNFFALTGLTVADARTPLVAQTETTGLLPILLEELETDNGDVIKNSHDGDNYFVTSFAALAPDATMTNGVYTSGDSYYDAFVLDVSSGNFAQFVSLRTGEIASYANAVIDSDDELWVNYTVFPFSSPPVVNVDEYDYYPLSAPPYYIDTYPFVDSTQPVQQCTTTSPYCACTTTLANNYCRWGDYVAQVIDASCDAFNNSLTPECGLVWGTSEYVYTPTSNVSFGSGVPECLANEECQASQVTAMYDDNTTDDTNDIKFVGYSTTESECGSSSCSLSIYPPSGVAPGDVLLLAMGAGFAQQSVPTMPSGWHALPFTNQGGAQKFNSYDEYGDEATGWLLTYVYGYLGKNEPSYYTFSESVSGGEVDGLMLAYRGVATPDVASFLAKGNGATSSTNYTVYTGKMTAVADENLVTIFSQGGDECNLAEISGDNYFSSPTPSGLYVMTPLTTSGDVQDSFAAQLWSGSGGTFGPYKSTDSIPECGGSNGVGIPLAWMVLLPSE
jgi:hypothetical protein